MMARTGIAMADWPEADGSRTVFQHERAGVCVVGRKPHRGRTVESVLRDGTQRFVVLAPRNPPRTQPPSTLRAALRNAALRRCGARGGLGVDGTVQSVITAY